MILVSARPDGSVVRLFSLSSAPANNLFNPSLFWKSEIRKKDKKVLICLKQTSSLDFFLCFCS